MKNKVIQFIDEFISLYKRHGVMDIKSIKYCIAHGEDNEFLMLLSEKDLIELDTYLKNEALLYSAGGIKHDAIGGTESKNFQSIMRSGVIFHITSSLFKFETYI